MSALFFCVTEWVSGGLLGNGGFWSDTMSAVPRHIQTAFGSRFY